MNKNASEDATIKNYAPDSDLVVVTIGDWRVSVDRDEDGRVTIAMEDTDEGSETVVVLGEEGYSQKL